MIRFPVLIALTVLIFVSISHKSHANPLPAKTLLSLCFSEKDADKLQCQGYIQGVIDYHNLTRSLGTAPTVDFCVPKDLSIKDVTNLVIAYMADNAQHDSFIASPAISLALFEQFPCSK